VRFGDGDGLYLQVAPGDTKSWLFRYTLRGKAREMGLGPVGELPERVPLATARILAAEAKALLRDGKDPLAEREAVLGARARAATEAQERTFRAAATALVDSKRSGWRNAKHGAQWLATLDAHVFPVIGDMPVSAVGTNDVLRVLRPIWERVPETASRVRQRIEAVLDAAKVKGWRTGENPARWKARLAGELPQPRKVKRVAHRPGAAVGSDKRLHGRTDASGRRRREGIAVHHPDGSADGRGARHAMAGGRPGREGLDRAGRADESRQDASRSTVTGCARRADGGSPAV